jgi:hypothetical protein
MGAPLTVADVLERAADLIEPEGAWTQHWSARTAEHRITTAMDRSAVCWCAGGAIVRAVGADNALSAAAYSALRSTLLSTVSDFNDAPERTQSDVVAKLREAAAISRGLPGGEGK